MARVAHKVALVTGAAKGMGRSHCVRLAEEGADIVALDHCTQEEGVQYPMGTPEDLAETAALVEKQGRRVVTVRADIRDLGALEKAVGDAKETLGSLDIVVANAGISTLGAAWELTPQQWQAVLDTNLTGTWNTVKATVPAMIAQGGGGSVVLVSSVAGIKGFGGMGHYSASKAGIIGLMQTLAQELGPHAIRVNTVNPGLINTDMSMNKALISQFLPDNPNPSTEDIAGAYAGLTILPNPWLEPVDVSNAVLWLASDEARYITGISVPVDGGQLVRA
ncbi:mycofactocin-coupled SDR family oxidoreductase [Amycolatopsis acidicola]|uniref:Mycofactocin-coupled SDR family oxidoreductase n=1 Tax=Amycolatopsis acidicola TaxID=2596893 RepID=A0A5N0UUL0_9PSEU|nr:mycofactocin-coupled SDR family oxidoreductase [Amycolatopsis acidicola]KAA9156342.1 mycofactocin-coupled SDR family oxidoreductase [Amycolatopsis acidicola]